MHSLSDQYNLSIGLTIELVKAQGNALPLPQWWALFCDECHHPYKAGNWPNGDLE